MNNIEFDINEYDTIIKDCSSGSNATTLLVLMQDNNFYYRKYAIGEHKSKLKDQANWIKKHQNIIRLPKISYEADTDRFFAYDMLTEKNAMTFFKYIHMNPIEDSIKILNNIIADIDNKLHSIEKICCDKDLLIKYIKTKVIDNYEKILQYQPIKSLDNNDRIVVNGVELKPLNYYKDFINVDYLFSIFEKDECSDIHGDLTIENIAIDKDGYYLIDPNVGNVHETPFQDYSKLLQSLHGCYEFLSFVNDVNYDKNKINFFSMKSIQYDSLYNFYKNYIVLNFVKYQKISIYWHEIVHWFRLMPYKISKKNELSIIYYARLLELLNEIAQ